MIEVSRSVRLTHGAHLQVRKNCLQAPVPLRFTRLSCICSCNHVMANITPQHLAN